MGKGPKLMNCPLCEFTGNFTLIYNLRQRDYLLCPECDLVFVDRKTVLKNEEEKERYSHHQNNIRSEGYLKFLDNLLVPLKRFISNKLIGLDYGSGPYPMMVEILQEQGHQVDSFDPYFAPEGIKRDKYDYITVCEVAEHFNFPGKEFEKLYSMLEANGILGIMTGIRNEEIHFPRWHYIQDETHISFYSPRTIKWISSKYNLTILYFEKNVVLFQKV